MSVQKIKTAQFVSGTGLIIHATVHYVHQTVTIKDHEGRDLRVQEMPRTAFNTVMATLTEIQTWAEAELAPAPAPDPDPAP